MSSRGGLGKGITSIFGTDVSQMLDDIQNGQSNIESSEPSRIPVDQIRPNPYQPRKVFDPAALEELASSIREDGVFTPILVKKSIQGYELIAGERRLRASRLAGESTIPAIVVDFDDQQMMEISLLENIQRENLNVIEEAKAYDQLLRNLHYTQEQLATRVGKSREHIANLLRLLRLPDDVSQMVVDKQLSMGHVRALLPLKDKAEMTRVAKEAIDESWSVRTMESRVRTLLDRKEKMEQRKAGLVTPNALSSSSSSTTPSAADSSGSADHPKEPSPEEHRENLFVQEAARSLESFFQTPVRIKPGSIVISYQDAQDLTRILELLNLTED